MEHEHLAAFRSARGQLEGIGKLNRLVRAINGLEVAIETKRRGPDFRRPPTLPMSPARHRARQDADRVHLDRIIGTVLRTARAADAPILDDNLPMVALMNRTDRTTDQANRVFALPACGGN